LKNISLCVAPAIEQFRIDLLPAEAIARAIVYAVEQPANVDVNEIVVRPTVQNYELLTAVNIVAPGAIP
jgi:hypothetical protein